MLFKPWIGYLTGKPIALVIVVKYLCEMISLCAAIGTGRASVTLSAPFSHDTVGVSDH